MGALGHPIICLVTDRRQLPEPHDESLVHLVAVGSAAGVNLIHLRERDLDDRRLYALTRRIVAVVAGTGASVVVNDRADVALAAGASGVHLRADSVPAERLRGLVGPRFVIGRSVHGSSEARTAAAGTDYLTMGTIYPTPSKGPDVPVAGLRGLEATCRAVSVPVLAIGGVTSDRLSEVAAAGAAGIAAIGLFSELQTVGSGDLETSLSRLVASVRRAFGA
jgi:thiamine-phosphate pyrophosphorylase